jgi:hypothetical protein
MLITSVHASVNNAYEDGEIKVFAQDKMLVINNEHGDLLPEISKDVARLIESDSFEAIVVIGKANYFNHKLKNFFEKIKKLTHLKVLYFGFYSRSDSVRGSLFEFLTGCSGLRVHIGGGYFQDHKKYSTEDFFVEIP